MLIVVVSIGNFIEELGRNMIFCSLREFYWWMLEGIIILWNLKFIYFFYILDIMYRGKKNGKERVLFIICRSLWCINKLSRVINR